MALAIDNSNSQAESSVSTSTLSFTCTGSNLVLVVPVIADRAISGVTYNTVAMSRQQLGTGAGNYNLAIYTLVAPATGAHDIVVTIASSGSVAFGAISLTGASGIGASTKNTQNTSPITTTITLTGTNSYTIEGQGGKTANTQGSSQTEWFDIAIGANPEHLSGAYKAQGASGATDLIFSTGDDAFGTGDVIVEVLAGTQQGSTAKNLSLLGAGT